MVKLTDDLCMPFDSVLIINSIPTKADMLKKWLCFYWVFARTAITKWFIELVQTN